MPGADGRHTAGAHRDHRPADGAGPGRAAALAAVPYDAGDKQPSRVSSLSLVRYLPMTNTDTGTWATGPGGDQQRARSSPGIPAPVRALSGSAMQGWDQGIRRCAVCWRRAWANGGANSCRCFNPGELLPSGGPPRRQGRPPAGRHQLLLLCRIEGRPPRLDLDLYPYLVSVQTTRATDYMSLLSGRVA